MKTVIDIGSNSVRLMSCEHGTVKKDLITTELSKGLFFTGKLSEQAMRRTIDAVKTLADRARSLGAVPYLFATEAVRSSKNSADFLALVTEETGLQTDVLNGREEATCGFLGATYAFRSEAAIASLDIGGASSELAVGKDHPDYAVSIPVGAVRLFDGCGRDRNKLEAEISAVLPLYGKVPPFEKLIAIGGTATTLAAYDLKLEVYDPARVHGHGISSSRLREITDELFAMTFEQLRRTPGIPPKRAEIISGGAFLLQSIAEYLNVAEIQISESDNLEGYLLLRQLQGADLTVTENRNA